MKTIIMAIALIACTIGGYAQDTKCTSKKTAHHKVVVRYATSGNKVAANKSSDINYISGRTYTGNYPKDKNKKKVYKPAPQRESNSRFDKPSTDPDYYLKLGDDDRCRWHCSPGI